MNKYLLDTNICVFLLRGKYNINDKVNHVGMGNCYVSEVTVAELWYGVECSSSRQHNAQILEQLLGDLNIVPFGDAVRQYAQEKSRLRKSGKPIDDFDLLIACTALTHDMVMVTDNTKHFTHVGGLKLKNWVER